MCTISSYAAIQIYLSIAFFFSYTSQFPTHILVYLYLTSGYQDLLQIRTVRQNQPYCCSNSGKLSAISLFIIFHVYLHVKSAVWLLKKQTSARPTGATIASRYKNGIGNGKSDRGITLAKSTIHNPIINYNQFANGFFKRLCHLKFSHQVICMHRR